MSAPSRPWTADDDDLMRRQSIGEFSMHKLEKKIRSSRESIIKRMLDLGYHPLIQKRKGLRLPTTSLQPLNVMPEPIPNDIINFAPSVGMDKLLLQLHKCHDDRRYEEMNLPMKRRA